jgi:hypothetical protein
VSREERGLEKKMNSITHLAGRKRERFSFITFILFMSNTPILRYFVSDTFGANAPDPTQAHVDADVHLETDLSILVDALENGDDDDLWLLRAGYPTKINSRGREVALPRHLVGIINSWHNKYGRLLWDKGQYNGIFVNYAPRTSRYKNGPPFYEVETNSGLRIVTTFPGDMLAGVHDSVHVIHEIPNENNPLFGNKAQFRSKDVHRYLRRGHQYPKIKLLDSAADDILRERHYGNDVDGLRFKFADIYGNMIAENDPEIRRKIEEAVRQGKTNVRISINGIDLPGEAALSMTDATDGAIAIYPNGPNIDVIRKWEEGNDSTFTTANSSYVQFGRPKENVQGFTVHFDGLEGNDP